MTDLSIFEAARKAPAGGAPAPAPAGDPGVDLSFFESARAPAPPAGARPPAPAPEPKQGDTFLNRLAPSTVGNVASAVDMAWGLLPQIAGVVVEAGSRIAYSGETKKIRDSAAAMDKQKFVETFDRPVGKLMKMFGFGEVYEEADIERVMRAIGKAVEKGGDKIETSTGGSVSKEDVLATIDAVTAGLGAAGAKFTLGKFEKKMAPTAQFEARPPAPILDRLNALEARLGRKISTPADLRKAEAELAADAFRDEIVGIPKALSTGEGKRSVADPRRRQGRAIETDALGNPIPPEAPRIDPALGVGEGARSVRDPRRQAVGGSGVMGSETPAARVDPALALGENARSVGDPKRRVVTDSGLEGLPPKERKTMLYGLAAGGAAAAFAAAYGEFDNENAAALASAGGLIALGAGRKLPMETLQALPDATPLGAILDRSPYTLSTLEMLPKNRFEFTRKEINELLTRSEVTDVERDILSNAFKAGRSAFSKDGPVVPRSEMPEGFRAPSDADRITAKDLMLAIKEATGDFELKRADFTNENPPPTFERREFSTLNEWGLPAIDRADRFNGAFEDIRDPAEFEGATARLSSDGRLWEVYDADGEYVTNLMRDRTVADEASAVERARQENQDRIDGPASATTTIYQSPVELGTGNHFSDPNYFAHTRSFIEGGVRHVVELQSDVAQRAGRALAPEERTRLVESRDNAKATLETIKKVENSLYGVGVTYDKVSSAVRGYLATYPDIELDIKLRMGNRLQEMIRNHPSRSFRESGLGKSITSVPEERVDEAFDVLLKAVDDYKDVTPENTPDSATRRNLRDDAGSAEELIRALFDTERNKTEVWLAEAESKLESSVVDPVRPMLKDWYKRLIREEVTRAAEGMPNPAHAKIKAQLDLQRQGVVNNKDYPEIARLLEEEAAQTEAQLAAIPERLPSKTVRFATADTVAKVEQWQMVDRYAELERTAADFRDRIRRIESVIGTRPRTGLVEDYRQRLANTEAELAATKPEGPRFLPEHQGIYDRYAGPVTKFLKSLGGKEVTDSKGVSWIEVPLEPKKGQPPLSGTQMFGIGAATLGAGLLSLMSEEEQGSAAAPIAAMALFAQSRSPAVRSAARSTLQGAENVLGNLSTSIRGISEAMLRPVRAHELGLLKNTYERLKATTPFVERLKSLPREKREAISAALFSGAPGQAISAVKALDPQLLPELAKARKVLADLGAGLVDTGKLKGLRPDYFPRIVIDYEGLLKHLGSEGGATVLEKRIFQAERRALADRGEALSPFDRSVIISDWLSQQFRGPGKAGFLKNRSVEQVTKDMLPFYAPADEALILYVRSATAEIERAKFFGRHIVRDPETNRVDISKSIHNVVEEKMRGKEVSIAQIEELKDLLNARFGPGERGMSGAVEVGKNLGYAALLAHPTSALVQLGDVATAVYAHGLLPTIKSVGMTLTRNGRITTADFGLIDNISAETASITGTARFVNKVFKWSGFNLVDRFGKSTAINASFEKNMRLARSEKGVAQLQRKFGEYFGDDFGALLSDLRAGKRTPLIDELVFSELSDIQPVSRVEMPKKYLEMQNGRALYMLKSFMLKQADIVRRDVWWEWKAGNQVQAAKNALRFGAALGIGGASTEFIRNWLLGRDDELEWSDIPANMLKTFMLSEYVLDQEGFADKMKAFGKSVLPPVGITYDIAKSGELTLDWLAGEAELGEGKLKALRYVPIIGTAAYHDAIPGQVELGLEFGGAEKANKDRERRELRKERREAME